MPGNVADLVAGHTIAGIGQTITVEQRDYISKIYHFDEPLHIQYIRWLSGIVIRGDWGESYIYHQPVITILLLSLPNTLLLCFIAISIGIIIGIPLGVESAAREKTHFDRFIRIITTFGISIPFFVIAIILMIIFSLKMNLLPITGSGGAAALILPSIVLAIGSICVITRIMRTSILETLGKPYISYARAKGLSPRYILWNHAFRNALIPVITVIGLYAGSLIANTVIIEKIFSLPGLGSLLIDSIFSRDIPVIQGCVILLVGIALIINLGIEILYHSINPMIKYDS